MEELLKSIQTHFAGSPLAEKVSGLFPYTAPQTTPAPYITFSVVSNVEGTAVSSMHNPAELTRIQFSVWGGEDDTSPLQVIKLRDALRSVFDSAQLNPAGAQIISLDWDNDVLQPDPDGGFVYHVDYLILYEEE